MNKAGRASLVMIMALLIGILAACSQTKENAAGSQTPDSNTPSAQASGSAETQSPAKKEKVTLEFFSNTSGGTLEAYQRIVDKFNQENPDIFVELTPQSKDYEALMNAKMATNDLPDLWNTHGWSVHKYSEYLRPLNDQPWASKLVNEIKPIVTDSAGNVYVLPFDVDISGMLYNVKILQELNITVPETWEQFLAACEVIKNAGYTPIAIGGKDTGDVAGFLGRVAPSFLTQDASVEYKDELKDGSFDWSHFDEVSKFILQLRDKGYYNVDYLTADKQAVFKGFAENKVAFAFQANNSIFEVLKLNPDAQISMMRIPVNNGSPFLISGERDAIGIWKDTEHEEEALKFLTYMSQPENVSQIAEAYSIPAALTDVQVNLGDLEEVFSKFSDVPVTNNFDREYLPNGMWNTLKVVGPGLLSGELNVENASRAMKTDYDRLRASAQ